MRKTTAQKRWKALFQTISLYRFRYTLVLAITFFPAASYSQATQSNVDIRTVHVQFKKDHQPPITPKGVSGRTTGLDKIDRVSANHNALSVKRIFPNAGVYEEAHRAFGLHLWYEIKFKEGTNLNRAIKEYRDTDYFEHVEESQKYTSVGNESTTAPDILTNGSNDPLFGNQWYLKNTGQSGGTPGADINVIHAWQVETGLPNVVVAVIDGGIDYLHADLKNNMWKNLKEIPGNGVDDDNNGYVDDVHGYGFGDKTSIIYPDGHATHVAGIIAAETNNSTGVAGIAGGSGTGDGVRLMTCAAFGRFDEGGFEEAMVYAADNGAVISQNSWRGGSAAIQAAIDYFISRAGMDNTAANYSKNIQIGPMAGGVVIFAAGNENSKDPQVGYPASYYPVIAVAATDHNDIKSTFSNYGGWVDISAPGTNIYSTLGTEYGYLSGTSMACPNVSGVAALIISKLQRPGLKPDEIWNRLRLSAKPLDLINPGYKSQLGWGRLDALPALRDPDAIPPPAITDLNVAQALGTSIQLSWTATDEGGADGQSAYYDLRFSKQPIDESNFKAAEAVQSPPVPPLPGETVNFTITSLEPGTLYYFAIKSVDVFNNVSDISNIASASTLLPPIPQVMTTELTVELLTGGKAEAEVLVKNIGEEPLLIRAGIPDQEPAPVGVPTGSVGRLFAINTSKSTIEEISLISREVVRSISLPESSSKTWEGLAFDGKHLYYGRSNNVFKINAESGLVERTYAINNASIINGLAWSGRYLYISKYPDNAIYVFDTNKGEITNKIDGYSEITFAGSKGTLYRTGTRSLIEVNPDDGTVIREVSVDTYPKGLAYSEANNLIFVANSIAPVINAIRPSDGGIEYTIPYPITTALAGDEYRPAWLRTIEEQVISINAGETASLTHSFVATELNTGSWSAMSNLVTVNSDSGVLQVPVTLNVTGAADIETAGQIDFGNQYVGFTIDTTVYIQNRGYANLVVSQIQSSDNRISSSLNNVTLAPGEKKEMIVSVDNSAPGSVAGSITVASDDPDEPIITIPVSAIILESPEITFDRDSLTATIPTGTDTTLTFIVTNTGKSDLSWSLELAGSSSPEVSQSSTFRHSFTEDPNQYLQSQVEEVILKAESPMALGSIAYDPVGDMIYGKSMTTSDFYRYDPAIDSWSHIGFAPATWFGQGAYLNGKIFFGGTQLNVYNVQAGTWASIPFPISGDAVSLTTGETFIYVAIGKIFYRYDPLSGTWLQLAEIPTPLYVGGIGGLSHVSGIIFATGTQYIAGDGKTTFYKYFVKTNTWIKTTSIDGKQSTGSAINTNAGEFFVVKGIQLSILQIIEGEWRYLAMPFSAGSTSGLVYVGREGHSGIYIIEGSNGNKFGLYKTDPAPGWINVTPTQGTVPANSNQTITVKLDAQGLFGGEYDGNFRIFSKHPPAEGKLPFRFTVIGASDISLDKSQADIGEVALGDSRNESLLIKNHGTDELVMSIASDNPDFSAVDSFYGTALSELVIPVSETKRVSGRFTPTKIGPQTGIFTFHSNDPDNPEVTFRLDGVGVYPPVLEIEKDSLYVELFSGDTYTPDIIITNTGGSTLDYCFRFDPYDFRKPWIKGSCSSLSAGNSTLIPISLNAEGLADSTYSTSVIFVERSEDLENRLIVTMKVVSAPGIAVSADSIDFGSQFVNTHHEQVIQFKNKGVYPLSITKIELAGEAFSFPLIDSVAVRGSLTLAPGESIEAAVSFDAGLLAQNYQDTLVIHTNDPSDQRVEIKLEGTAIIPPSLSIPNSLISVTLTEGESATRVTQVTNQGNSVLNWRISELNNSSTFAGEFVSKPSTNDALTGITFDSSSSSLYAQRLRYSDLYKYDFNAAQWQDIGGLHASSRGQSDAVILNGKMYCTYTERYDKIYIRDMTLNIWFTRPNQLGAKSATITTDGSLIYLAGGGKFVSYNPINDEWNELSIPQFTLDGLGGLEYHNGYIYAHASSTISFARYSIITGVWEGLLSLPGEAFLGSALDPTRGRYYAYGRLEGNSYLYEYDIESKVWSAFYSPLFQNSMNGGMAFVSSGQHEGVYFLQGKDGYGFGHYRPRDEMPWLRSAPFLGKLEPTDSEVIGINFNASKLPSGTYNGALQIISNDPYRPIDQIPVRLEVKSLRPKIKIPSFVTDSLEKFEETYSPFIIENEGAEPLEWSIDDPLAWWIIPEQRSGIVPAFSRDTISIRIIAGDVLGHGYSYVASVTSNDPANPVTTVTFNLYIKNSSPVVVQEFEDQNLGFFPALFAVDNYFEDPNGDPLTYEVTSSNELTAEARLEGTTLILSPLQSGNTTIALTATDDYNASVTLTFNALVIISDIPENQSQNFTAWPNPFKDKIFVEVSTTISSDAYLLLYDATGRDLWRSNTLTQALQNKIEVNLTNLASGLYYLVLVKDGKHTDSKRVIKR